MHYITVHEDVLALCAESNSKSIFNQRFKVTINDKVEWLGGSVSLGNRTAYIVLSKARMKILDVHLGDMVNVKLNKDNSEYGHEVPIEFEELLKQDAEAKTRFESLTKGMQRNIIYLVIQPKSSEKKIEKSILYLENLKKSPLNKTTMRHILGKDLP